MRTYVAFGLCVLSLLTACSKNSGGGSQVGPGGVTSQNQPPVFNGSQLVPGYEYFEYINGQRCTTGRKESMTLAQYCQVIVDNAANNNCAVTQRQQSYQMYCQNGSVFGQGQIPGQFPGQVGGQFPGQGGGQIPGPIQPNTPATSVTCSVFQLQRGAGGQRRIGRSYTINWDGQTSYNAEIPIRSNDNNFNRRNRVSVVLQNSANGPQAMISTWSRIDQETEQVLSSQGLLSSPLLAATINQSQGIEVSCMSVQPQVRNISFSQIRCVGQARISNRRISIDQVMNWNGQTPASGNFSGVSSSDLEIQAQLVPQMANQAAQIRLQVRDRILQFVRSFSATVDTQEMHFHSNEGRSTSLDLSCRAQ